LYINICKNIYIYVLAYTTQEKKLLLREKEQQAWWLEAIKMPDRLSVGLMNWDLLA
jgi:hypothetical protein